MLVRVSGLVTESSSAPVVPPRAWRRWLSLAAPYAIAAAVIAYLATQHSPREILAELRAGDATWLPALAIVMVLISLTGVSTADTLVLRGLFEAQIRVRWRSVVAAKAATSLLDLVAYALGHGTYAVWVARRAKLSPIGAAGAILYVGASDLAAVCLVASAAIYGGGVDAGVIGIAAPAIAGFLLLTMVVGPWRPLGRVQIFAAWADLSRVRALAQLALRVCMITIFCAATFVAMRAFGLDVPAWAVAAYLPVVLLVGSMPVNVAGFGAVQATWLLFEPWAPAPRILAFQLVWQLALTTAIVLRGLPFIRRALR